MIGDGGTEEQQQEPAFRSTRSESAHLPQHPAHRGKDRGICLGFQRRPNFAASSFLVVLSSVTAQPDCHAQQVRIDVSRKVFFFFFIALRCRYIKRGLIIQRADELVL